MDRIEIEMRGEDAAHLDLDAVFARAGFYETDDGKFIDADTGVIFS